MTTTFCTPYYAQWPKIQSAIKVDNTIEQAVRHIVEQMTLEEKIGQMIQPELRDITPQEVELYKIGSILNGGGAWPNGNKRAMAKEWISSADGYWHAAETAFENRPFRIPFMWATDAVHGHNNAFCSTVFPHNIGLGCARDTELIYRIGRVTALEIAATGLDWTFAPTVATPRDLRWGRVYEGYSEDPEVVFAYAGEMVKGLQGNADELKDEYHVISNVKHWLGDGGTATGVDRGVNNYSEDLMRNIHAMGYFSGLDAGAQVVMSSFNSWADPSNYDHSPDTEDNYNNKIHGSKYLLTGVLKQAMGFDGLIVTDWHGHAEVSKCSDGNASYAINAGNDILMIPTRKHWQAVYHRTRKDVLNGTIDISRINDAVTRILRVKMRAGLWDKPCPSARKLAGEQHILGAPQHREVAREAVRKSLVLLKNNNRILPLKRDQQIILTGSAANDLQKQSGGWNLTWQGDENGLDDFPGATTVKMALEAELGAEQICYDPDLNTQWQEGDIAIVAFGEDPYAEMMGDIKAWQTLEFRTLKRSYAADCEKIKQLHQQGVKVISLFFSGRPLYVNQEIALSESFIAAFLPGSEGKGITDVLVENKQGEPQFDFTGRLSFSWPNKKRSTSVHRLPTHIPNYQLPEFEQDPQGEHAPLFEYGYGLNYRDTPQVRDLDNLDIEEESDQRQQYATLPIHLYGVNATIGDYQLKVADSAHWTGVDVSRNNSLSLSEIRTKPYNYQQQQDAVELQCCGEGLSVVYVQTSDGQVMDYSQYQAGTLQFELKVSGKATKPVYISVQKPALASQLHDHTKFDISHFCSEIRDEFVTVSIPCEFFHKNGVPIAHLDTPFVLFSEGALSIVLANICWNPS